MFKTRKSVFIVFVLVLFLISYIVCHENEKQFCEKNEPEKCGSEIPETRHILYDVNPPEGFNLRRDVYIRMAVFVYNLKHSRNDVLKNFKLVLPPWVNLYHWSHHDQDKHYPWSHFFDLKSLQKFAPVIEMNEFFNAVGTDDDGKVYVDELYILQHYDDMFETGNFEENMARTKCKNDTSIQFFYYPNLRTKSIECWSFHGHVSQLSILLLQLKARSIMFDHAEIPLHDQYGSKLYWQARRSMRFNRKLKHIADEFREKYLNSTDVSDNTVLPDDWTEEQPQRTALGGPYISVHMRRRDFLWGRPDQVPSIKGAAVQIKKLLKENDVDKVFIATDAPKKEFQKLQELISEDGFTVYKFEDPDPGHQLSGGQIAVVDQIICSYARYFIGTHESTFSYRIQEEREILGFPTHTTFNRLCGDDSTKCEKPSMWKIVY